jgi:UDP-N-acetylglucosamine--N-acetylmuramyl-(pentapeptide) pyrophosphoryl-undecaprenol N-acetylglucosamine transferase
MKIIIASSNTGGHIFPALSLAQKLKQKNFQIYFVTDKGRIENKIIEKGFNLETISATKLYLNSPLAFLNSVINLLKSFPESAAIINKINPDVVIGFGGYASFPAVMTAGIYKIPVIIHEQNVIPGRVNRIASFFAKKVAVSFPEAKKYFNSRKVITTGCPIREDLFQVGKDAALKEFNFKSDKFTILVMGGSQGSHKINEQFIKVISKIEDISMFQIIHLTGRNDFNYVKNTYGRTGVSACCVAFLEEMSYAYSIADLIISRAGASTLAEIITFKIPSVLIPYPFAYGHQKANAIILAEKGASIIIEDKDLSAEKLKEVLLQFLNSRDSLKKMKDALDKINVLNAADNLAELVISTGKK